MVEYLVELLLLLGAGTGLVVVGEDEHVVDRVIQPEIQLDEGLEFLTGVLDQVGKAELPARLLQPLRPDRPPDLHNYIAAYLPESRMP